MKKGDFYIAIYSKEVNGFGKKKVSGWIDADKNIGYHKKEMKWTATDIKSGLRIVDGATKSGCIENVKEMEEKIKERKEDGSYIDFLERFKNFPIVNN